MNRVQPSGPVDRPGRGEVGEVQIDRVGDRSIVVRRDVPGDSRRRGIQVVAVGCLALCLAPAIVLAVWHHGLDGKFASAATAFMTVPLAVRILRQFTANTCSTTIRADAGGLTIDRTTCWRRTTRHLSRGQVAEVLLDCSGGPDPHHTVFRSKLLVRPSAGRDIDCLHNVAGDELANIANAIRAALGLPARSWP